MLSRIIISVIALSVAVIIPFFFAELLYWFAPITGWVVGTILIRLLVILLTTVALHQLFKSFSRTSRIKAWITVLIALPVGFGISFLEPIYAVDYGLFNDGMKLEKIEELEQKASIRIKPAKGHALIAFFTTTCPHCMAASEKLGFNLEHAQKIPVTAIFPGSMEDADAFLQKHGGQNFNHSVIDDDELFIGLTGGVFPSIFLIDEKGETTFHWTGDELNFSALDYINSLEQ